MIASFIADTMSFRDTKLFLDHIESCQVCRDETELALLIHETNVPLTEARYDLRSLFSEMIEKKKREVTLARICKIIVLIVLLALLAGIIIYFVKKGIR